MGREAEEGRDALKMVLPIILSLLETSHPPRDGCSSIRTESCHSEATIAASNFERPSSTFLSGTLSAIRTNFLQREFHMMGWGRARRGAGTVLKNFESALNRLNGIPSYETFLSRELFFQNSWFTRHSAWIMFRLPEITRDLSRRNIILPFAVYAEKYY